ncbi:hypothetical protein FND50_26640 [Rhodococcus sp. WB9]|uniref:phospholipase D family protein n=1 Tax=Rhodococcus sp. WB9 TaxID=2594007 RepID=UPI00118573B2|nr:phospholipase D family protein [Rhodococcus sp. WB9]QDQ93991.1 hypothetical protein FND50_26640 [Rhodococcus sp. WB9]
MTDALQPPTGYEVDSVVTTTYSLDLTALLVAPLALAARSHDATDIESLAPIAILDSLRRYVRSMTVFCQAGALRTPGKFRSLMSFAEDAVVEVQAPTEGRLFHPKIWLIRFVDEDKGVYLHRFLCSSRNLTFDASWDTLLVLDEEETALDIVDPTPLADFLTALPALAVTPMADGRSRSVRDIAGTVREARFTCPAPFTSLAMYPLGLIADAESLPVPRSADRAIVISPFFDVSTARTFSTIGSNTRVISRAETFDRTGSAAFTSSENYVLQNVADRPGGDDEPSESASEIDGVPTGLHAKTFLFDHGKEALLITGSANATGAALHGNVEFSVGLRGPVAKCGVNVLWDGGRESTGFAKIAEPYTIPSAQPDAECEALAHIEKDMADFRAEFAATRPELHFDLRGDDTAECVLRIPGNSTLSFDGEVLVTLISLRNEYVPLNSAVAWTGVATSNITPFISVQTRRGSIVRVGVVKASLCGDTTARDKFILRQHISNQRALTLCLLFLLGGVVPGELDELIEIQRGEQGQLASRHIDDAALFEPLVRAVVGDRAALERIDSLIRDLDEPATGGTLINDELRSLLDAVRAAHSAVAGGVLK